MFKRLKYAMCCLAMFIGVLCTNVHAAPTHYITPFDKIPNFGANPTIVAVQNGNWSDTATWNTGTVPSINDIVQINNMQVLYDASAGNASVIHIQNNGKLHFSTSQNTHLNVTTILVTENGTLEIGTLTNPISSFNTTTIQFNDVPLNTASDPYQFSNGLVVVDGNVVMYGASKLPTFVRVNEIRQNSNVIQAQVNVPTWALNDVVVVPDTRMLAANQTTNTFGQLELVQVANVNQTTINLVTPTTYSHSGVRNSLTNTLDYTPHVGNITRNIVLKSANPQGVRGHVMFTRLSNVDVQHVRFENLGRTTTGTLHSTQENAQGIITQIGTNQIGRYSLHLHHVVPTYKLVGNTVVNTGGVHNKKWAITLHDVHYGSVTDNIMYNCAGACLMTEQANETNNVIARNFAIGATGTGNRSGEGSEATGFWFRGPNNYVYENVAANIISASIGTQHCGYSYWQQYAGNAKIPNGPGADTTVNGQFTTKSVYTLPLLQFENNEVYASTCGGTAWWLGAEYITPRSSADSIIKNFVAWNIFGSVWHNYHNHRLIFDNWIVRGNSPTATACCNHFYLGLDYFSSDFIVKNSSLHGLRGIYVSTDTKGIQLFKDSEIVSLDQGFVFHTLWTSGSDTNALKSRETVIDNVKVVPIPGKTTKYANFIYTATPIRTLIRPDKVYISNYQQVQGVNFHAYYTQQNASFIVPKTILNSVNKPSVEGSPVANLTNAQNMVEYNIAIAGEIAPCTDTTTHPEIAGITCPEVINIPDTELPTTPSNIVTERYVTSIQLNWQASTDNVAVQHYIVKRNGVQIAVVTSPTYTDVNLTPFTVYNYEVYAVDTSNNVSTSALVTARTLTFVNPPAPYNTWLQLNEGLHDSTDVICIMQGPSAQDTLQYFNLYLQNK